ncbi:MAG: flagellar biosynthesis anti-sigma factor FlgM [Spirochaetota bacterium]|nr:MAG: flagellar biosynthesis anti-sigma factor FlgM [Spirochaetota bacterium]
MTIDKIGPLNKILKAQSDIQIKKSGKASKKDRVELSSEAKRMAELSKAEAKVKAAPDIRKELTPQRIKELREKLENPDQYLTKEVARQIAEKVAESFGIK